jgi:hypothetical protein
MLPAINAGTRPAFSLPSQAVEAYAMGDDALHGVHLGAAAPDIAVLVLSIRQHEADKGEGEDQQWQGEGR